MSDNKVYCNSVFKAVLGENYGKIEYGNLIHKNKITAEFYLQNKENAEITQVTGYENKWGQGQVRLPEFILNEIPTTLCDFVGGEKNKDSYNFLIDLSFSEPINKAVFTAGAGKSFYPTRLNVYLSDSKEEIFSKDIRPVKVFNSKNDDGIYSAEFEPVRARFVRFEVVDTENDYFGGKLITVVKELAVFGALNAKQQSFGLELLKKITTVYAEPASVMAPYLYKNGSSWVEHEIKPVDDEILKEISREKVGDQYLKIIFSAKNIINIGITDVASEISTADDLPEIDSNDKVYFYVKLANSAGFSSGKIKLQVVTRHHKSVFVPIALEADKWTKIDVTGIFNFEKENLRRIMLFADDGALNTETTVGSIQVAKHIDSSVWGVDIDSIVDMTPETVPDNFKNLLSQYNIYF